MASLAFRNVEKTFGSVKVIHGIGFDIADGEFTVLVGPSGCGKSTLLHLLASLDAPTSGSIEVFGQSLASLPNPARFRKETVGLVFQLHNLLPQLTAVGNVEIAMFGSSLHRRERRARARQLLVDVDLAGRELRQPTRLSGGERQRVAIARALANDPPLLLADEPTGSLDTASVVHVIELIRRLRIARPELTVVMVTHDAQVAAAADRIVTMRDGQIDSEAAQPAPLLT